MINKSVSSERSKGWFCSPSKRTLIDVACWVEWLWFRNSWAQTIRLTWFVWMVMKDKGNCYFWGLDLKTIKGPNSFSLHYARVKTIKVTEDEAIWSLLRMPIYTVLGLPALFHWDPQFCLAGGGCTMDASRLLSGELQSLHNKKLAEAFSSKVLPATNILETGPARSGSPFFLPTPTTLDTDMPGNTLSALSIHSLWWRRWCCWWECCCCRWWWWWWWWRQQSSWKWRVSRSSGLRLPLTTNELYTDVQNTLHIYWIVFEHTFKTMVCSKPMICLFSTHYCYPQR